MFHRNFRTYLLAGAASLCLAPQAFAGNFTVPPSSGSQSLVTGQTGTIMSGATLSGTITWTLNTAGIAPATVNNYGTVDGGSSGRAIETSKSASGAQSFTLNNGTVTNSTALITSSGNDAVHIDNDIKGGTVTVDNFGTIQSTGIGAVNGQALDFDKASSATNTITITNEASGVITAADADAIRPGNSSTIYNYGRIQSYNGSPASTGNDAIDYQDTNNGAVYNYASGSIIGARDGITGKIAPTVYNEGIITGQAGSGLNIDSTNLITNVTNTSTGIITGNIPSGSAVDGDGVDVDYLVNLQNSGQILAKGIGLGGETNEALAIGGGVVVNNASGIIRSDQRAITVDNSGLAAAPGAVSIDNFGTIEGKNGEAIKTVGTHGNTLTNEQGGIIKGSVVMDAGDDTINLNTGSTLNGTIDTGAGNDTIHLTGTGAGTLSGVSNVETLKVDGGTWKLSGGQNYASGTTVAAGATANVSGALGGDVTNNGTVKVENGAASFNGTFHSNGAIISDPASLEFNNIAIGSTGYIQAAAGDLYKVDGNFNNASTQNTLWDTTQAILEFSGVPGTNHALDLIGADLGRNLSPADNFAWGTLDIDTGNTIDVTNGLGSGPGAFYVTDLLGALISGDEITNISGIDGLIIYYDGHSGANGYLGERTYQLANGGLLVSDVPEPRTLALFIAGLGLLGGLMRRRSAGTAAPLA